MIKNNTTDKSATELIDLIVKVERAKGNSNVAYAIATGVLNCIIDYARKSSTKNALQEEINANYERYSNKALQAA